MDATATTDPTLLPSGSIQSYGGAVAEVGDAETAFGHRDALVAFVAVAGWSDPAEDQPRMSAAGRYAGAVEPFASGVYVNALGDEGQTGIRAPTGRQAGKADRAEGPLRPRQCLPPQPQHPPLERMRAG